jgi:hypothetical protein
MSEDTDRRFAEQAEYNEIMLNMIYTLANRVALLGKGNPSYEALDNMLASMPKKDLFRHLKH